MSEFTDYLIEVFEPFGPVSARRMFGGHGIYHDGLMFGLVADDVLYLKVDSESSMLFEAENLPHFVYVKNGKPMEMSYRQAPEAIFDDPDEAKRWGTIAYDAALRAKKLKKNRKR